MPKLTRTEIEERERFTIDTWKALWPKGPEAKGEVPAAVVNDIIHKKFGENMRSDKVYRLRDQAIDELRTSGFVVPNPPRKYRRNPLPERPEPRYSGQPNSYATPVQAQRPEFVSMPVVVQNPPPAIDSSSLPYMIRGVSEDGAAAITKALEDLRRAGLVRLRVEHSGQGYVLINSAQ